MAVKDLMICQNFKGNLYGNLGNTEAITVNMEGCGPELLEGRYDLYCTTRQGGQCYTFDGTDDGNVVMIDFVFLLEWAMAFKILTLFGTFVFTTCALYAILDKHMHRNSVVSPEQDLEMLREEMEGAGGGMNKKSKPKSKALKGKVFNASSMYSSSESKSSAYITDEQLGF